MTIGERVEALRISKGINQTALAKSVKSSSAMISLIEANKSKPTLELLQNLSEFFEVSTDYLLTGKEGTSEINEEEREVLEFMRKDVDFKKAVTQAANFKKKALNFLSSYQPHPAHAA